MSERKQRAGNPRIEGVVLDQHRRPIADCSVLLTGDSPEHSDIAALTAADGTFSFHDLEPGRYEVLARTEDGRSEVGVVTLGEPTVSRIEIRLSG